MVIKTERRNYVVCLLNQFTHTINTFKNTKEKVGKIKKMQNTKIERNEKTKTKKK